MKKILVAVDFSNTSENAMDYAAALAKTFNADVVLIHAFFMPVPVGDVPGYLPLSFAEVEQQNEALLEKDVAYMAEKNLLAVKAYVRNGLAADVIKEVAAEINADLIVMGINGAGNADSIFGSTVTAAIRKIKKPLLIVPGTSKFSAIKMISLADDFKNRSSYEDFKMLQQIALKFDAEIQVIHVQTQKAIGAEEAVGKISANIILDKLKHSFYTIDDTDVEKGISQAMVKYPADLLVMIAHHHNIFERIFGKIHSNLTAYQTLVPLLVLHD